MYMTDGEILGKYKKAENKKEMLQILADLNGCDKDSMKQFLLDHGIPRSDFEVKGRKPKVKQDAEKKFQEPIEKEQIRLKRALVIPIPVRQAVADRIEALNEKVIELERERDFLCDFLEGRVTEYAGS